jgi:hypothetical protein
VSELKTTAAAMISLIIMFILITSGCMDHRNVSPEVVKSEYLNILRTTSDNETATAYGEKIRQAVNDNVTSWKELAVNDSDIDAMVKAARIRGIDSNFETLRETFSYKDAISSAEYIREEVANGDTSWKTLGITETDLDILVKAASTRYCKESSAAQKRRND